MSQPVGTILAVLSVTLGTRARAQVQPPTIPTIIAEAMTFEPFAIGKPQFFDAQTPTNWPSVLVPANVRVLGGGMIGDSSFFRIRVAVFEFPSQANAKEVIRDLVSRAGYTRGPRRSRNDAGGFVNSAPDTVDDKYCKGGSLVGFAAVDSVQAPRAFAIQLVDGEAGRQNCIASEMPPTMMPPVTIPSLTPPPGATPISGGGTGWSGNTGEARGSIRTTMPTDSVLAHYTKLLVAGGWKAEKKPALADGAGLQRFSFREGNTAWSGLLIILEAGDHLELTLRFAMAD